MLPSKHGLGSTPGPGVSVAFRPGFCQAVLENRDGGFSQTPSSLQVPAPNAVAAPAWVEAPRALASGHANGLTSAQLELTWLGDHGPLGMVVAAAKPVRASSATRNRGLSAVGEAGLAECQ